MRSLDCQWLMLALALSFGTPAFAGQYECSWLLEPLAFRFWSSQAGKPTAFDFDGLDGLSVASIKTEVTSPKGAEALNGYRLAPNDATQPVRGRLLVIQGNGHRASALLKPLSEIARSGLEIFIYDFRGYANSDLGNPSASQIIDDYRQIITSTSSAIVLPYFIYGVSFGGVVALNAIQPKLRITKLVLDSVPDTLSRLGCPNSWDAKERAKIAKVPTFYIVAGKDTVVPKSSQLELIEAYTNKLGSKVAEASNSFHPFTPGAQEKERIKLLLEALRND